MPVKFIHASDIHLGHQQFNLEERFHDFGRAFGRVVDTALAENVDFIIIGGDFFHKRAINAETLRQAMELLEPLKKAGIPVIVIEGNHDKAYYQDKSSWLKLLNSLGYLILLKPVFDQGKITLTPWSPNGDGSVIYQAGIRIVGLGYLGATTEQRLRETAAQLAADDAFTILLLHAGINKLLDRDLGGVKKETLNCFRSSVDYLALGHIHTRDEIDDWAYNPGSLENCHLDEANEGRSKGFYLVSVDGKNKKVKYIPAKPRETLLIKVDITGSADPAEACQKARDALRALNINKEEKTMLQLNLKGDIDFSALAIDTASLAREIKEEYGCLYVEVQNNANLPGQEDLTAGVDIIDRAAIESRVLSQLVRINYPRLRDCSEELVSLIIRVKEAALAGEPPEEIINAISGPAQKLPLTEEISGAGEVAAGGETNEN